MAEKKLNKGDTVQWKSRQGTTEGKVEKKLTRPTKIKSHSVKASAEDPQYLVKSKKTGAKAAHKPKALRKQ